MKRSPLQRKTPLRSRSRLAPMSKKRRAEQAERAEVRRRAFERDGHACQGARLVPDVACAGPLDAHEITPRGSHPGAHLDLSVVVTLCRAHHDWTHANPYAAYAAGLLRRRSA